MNKKMIFSLSALFVCFGAVAQIGQSRILASGSLGFSASNYKELDNGITDYEFNAIYLWFMPKVGYFITDEIAVGVGLNLSAGSTKYDDDDKYISSSITFNPFARYYFPQGFFGQLEIGLGSETNRWKDEEDDDKYKYQVFIWSLGAGYAHFLNDFVAIEPMVTYAINSSTFQDNKDFKDKNSVLLFQVGLSIYLDR